MPRSLATKILEEKTAEVRRLTRSVSAGGGSTRDLLAAAQELSRYLPETERERDEVLVAAAMCLVSGGAISTGVGAELLGIPKVSFLSLMPNVGGSLPVSVEDVRHDVETVREIQRERRARRRPRG